MLSIFLFNYCTEDSLLGSNFALQCGELVLKNLWQLINSNFRIYDTFYLDRQLMLLSFLKALQIPSNNQLLSFFLMQNNTHSKFTAERI